MKSTQSPWRRCHFTGSSILSSGRHFVERSKTILGILVEGHPRKHSCEIILKSAHWPSIHVINFKEASGRFLFHFLEVFKKYIEYI